MLRSRREVLIRGLEVVMRRGAARRAVLYMVTRGNYKIRAKDRTKENVVVQIGSYGSGGRLVSIMSSNAKN